MNYIESLKQKSRYAPVGLRLPLEVIMTIALKGSVTRADGTTCFGYAGTIVFPHCEPLHFASPALAREANAVYALAFRRAQKIVTKLIGSDADVSYVIVTQKAGLEVRLETVSILKSRDGFRTNFSQADAMGTWTPFEEKYAKGQVRFREFTGLVKKAPIGFRELMNFAVQQCEIAKAWETAAYVPHFGETFDRYDIDGYSGPMRQAA